MSLFKFLFGSRPKSAAVAKERLQLIIARERAGRFGPDFLPALKEELINVISKYVHINPHDIQVSLEKRENLEVLELNVVLGGPVVAEGN